MRRFLLVLLLPMFALLPGAAHAATVVVTSSPASVTVGQTVTYDVRVGAPSGDVSGAQLVITPASGFVVQKILPGGAEGAGTVDVDSLATGGHQDFKVTMRAPAAAAMAAGPFVADVKKNGSAIAPKDDDTSIDVKPVAVVIASPTKSLFPGAPGSVGTSLVLVNQSTVDWTDPVSVTPKWKSAAVTSPETSGHGEGTVGFTVSAGATAPVMDVAISDSATVVKVGSTSVDADISGNAKVQVVAKPTLSWTTSSLSIAAGTSATATLKLTNHATGVGTGNVTATISDGSGVQAPNSATLNAPAGGADSEAITVAAQSSASGSSSVSASYAAFGGHPTVSLPIAITPAGSATPAPTPAPALPTPVPTVTPAPTPTPDLPNPTPLPTSIQFGWAWIKNPFLAPSRSPYFAGLITLNGETPTSKWCKNVRADVQVQWRTGGRWKTLTKKAKNEIRYVKQTSKRAAGCRMTFSKPSVKFTRGWKGQRYRYDVTLRAVKRLRWNGQKLPKPKTTKLPELAKLMLTVG